MKNRPHPEAALEACLWLTPKIFDDVSNPAPGVRAFFDHHAEWLDGRRATFVFCAGNGDHILNYAGEASWAATFDWARYNCYAVPDGGPDSTTRGHNQDWLNRVREGGERSFNPYSAGPMMILSEQVMDYSRLAGIYTAIRSEAAARGIEVQLLEYLEPGPEFCRSEWKTERHPEVASASADAGGHMVPGVVDVTLPLNGDESPYAAYPTGFPEGLLAGDFVAAQCGTFVSDFGLDGILLGNQFGLVGFWHPENAPELTTERAAGIDRFFSQLREKMGSKLIYWMDTYWSVPVEKTAWGMSDSAYQSLDAIIVSTFAVLVERTEIVPNLETKAALRTDLTGPRIFMGLDFVDPWYWYRTHLDDRRTYLAQREILRSHPELVDGVTFFANDTFGHFVPAKPLNETLNTVIAIDQARSAIRNLEPIL